MRKLLKTNDLIFGVSPTETYRREEENRYFGGFRGRDEGGHSRLGRSTLKVV